MNKITYIAKNSSGHISQILTGFNMLKEQGIIDYEVNICNELKQYNIYHMTVEAEINGKKIAFNTLDGYNVEMHNLQRYLVELDFYFKRSYSDEMNQYFPEELRKKIYPLGFNYHVTFENNPIDFQISFLRKLKRLIKWFIIGGPHFGSNSYFTSEVLQSAPNYKEDNLRILFSTRLWGGGG